MPLALLPLPPVIRVASELAAAVTAYHPEDHPAILAAQAKPWHDPDAVSPEVQFAWHDALDRIVESANRLKRALGADGELDPARRARQGGDAPRWVNYDTTFGDVDHQRAIRVGLMRLALAAIDLSGYGQVKMPPEEWREPALAQLGRGIQQVWPALSLTERDAIRGCLPDIRSAAGWEGEATADPPVWDGPEAIAPDEQYRIIDLSAGYYASTSARLDELHEISVALAARGKTGENGNVRLPSPPPDNPDTPEAGENNPVQPTAAHLAAKDIATALGLGANPNPVEVALRRFAESNPACRDELKSPRRGEARIMYRVAMVWPMLIEKLPQWRRTTPTPTPE